MVQEDSPSDTAAMAAMKVALNRLETEEGRRRGYDLKPDPGAIIVASPPKCGTTWMQHIVHGLRSRGNMDFDEISIAVPCLEMAWDSGVDPLAPQAHSPAAYKTHFYYPHCPSGCKKIFVLRDPMDAGPSFYKFLNGWFFEKDSIPMEAFLNEFFLRRGEPESWLNNASIWHNIRSWYAHRADSDVLWIHFEDMKEDLPACVDLIAEYIGCGADDKELKELVVKQSSIEFMSAHSAKFDEHHLKLARNTICGLPERAGLDGQSAPKVRAGQTGTGEAQLSAEMVQAIQRKWAEVVAPVCGCGTYAEMRDEVNRELRRPWAKPAQQ
eukprot:jgi/Tetstr1/430328/TSEL_020153.t1